MIPYPHRVTIERRHAAGADSFGRPGLGAYVVAGAVPAWIQDLSANEQLLLTQAGVVDARYLIYMDPTDLTVADQLDWNGEKIEVLEIRDPDHAGDHFEVVGRIYRKIPAVPA